MEEYRGTDIREGIKGEALYFSPSWHNHSVISQSIAIAALHDNEMSLIAGKSYDGFPYDFVHFVFTEEEVDLLINALQEVKERWKTGEIVEWEK